VTGRDRVADRIAERVDAYLARHWAGIPELERLALSAGLGVELVDELVQLQLHVELDELVPAGDEPPAQLVTLPAVRALSELVDDARWLIPVAIACKRRHVAHRLAVVAAQLDACRTRLVQEGDSYSATAWAWVDAGRTAIANYKLTLPTRTPAYGAPCVACGDEGHHVDHGEQQT
jgi:hypothetical protein